MSNRFTDTEKYSDDWYRGLDCQHQRMWDYILLRCNHAGIWKVSHHEAAHHLRNKRLPWDSFLEAMEGRVEVIDGGARWFIPKFIKFQYPTGLNEKSSVHKGVIRLLRMSGLLDRVLSLYGEAFVSLLNPSEGFGGIKDKNKNKNKTLNQTQDKKSEGESEREPDPGAVFDNAPKPIPLASVPLGPHEIRAPLIAAGAKFYGQEDSAGWLGVVRRCGGLARVVAFMDRMPAEDRADRVKVETFIQREGRTRQKAVRLDNAGEAARESHAARTALENEIKANNAAAKEPLTRICDYLCDPETAQDIRDRAAADASIESALKLIRDGKSSAIVLGNILRKFPELKAIAHSTEKQPA